MLTWDHAVAAVLQAILVGLYQLRDLTRGPQFWRKSMWWFSGRGTTWIWGALHAGLAVAFYWWVLPLVLWVLEYALHGGSAPSGKLFLAEAPAWRAVAAVVLYLALMRARVRQGNVRLGIALLLEPVRKPLHYRLHWRMTQEDHGNTLSGLRILHESTADQSKRSDAVRIALGQLEAFLGPEGRSNRSEHLVGLRERLDRDFKGGAITRDEYIADLVGLLSSHVSNWREMQRLLEIGIGAALHSTTAGSGSGSRAMPGGGGRRVNTAWAKVLVALVMVTGTIFVAVWQSQSPRDAGPDAFEVGGMVVDQTNRPIRNVTITCDRPSLNSETVDSQGKYRIRVPKTESVPLSVSCLFVAPDFESQQRDLTIDRGATLPTVILSKQSQ